MGVNLAERLAGRRSVGLLACCVSAVSMRNPVHAVLSLVGGFGLGSMRLMVTGSEFLSMVLVVVYMGAVAVLFLFVVMMLNPGQRAGSDVGGQYPLMLILGGLGVLGL